MFPVHVGSLVSLNATKEYDSSPFHAAPYKAELRAGQEGRVTGISAHDPDTFYIKMRNGQNHIVVAKREDFSVVKE